MPLMLATLDQQELSISSSFIGNEVASTTTANVTTSGSKSPSSPSPTKSMSVATNHHYYNYMSVTTNAKPIAVANFKINNHNNNNNNEQVAANAFTASTNALTPQINNFGNDQQQQQQQQVSNAKTSFFNPAFSINDKSSFYANNRENMGGDEDEEKERQIAANTRYVDNYRSWNNKDFFANTKNWNIHDRMTDSQNTVEMRIKKEQVKEEEEEEEEESVAADISEKNVPKAELINGKFDACINRRVNCFLDLINTFCVKALPS
uniref:Uncharacterized protein n=1 Tax=Glossina austeni TaxID=7395 RepID=A0A1A9UQA8_GLOAU